MTDIHHIPLVASFTYYAFTIFFSRILRNVCKQTLPRSILIHAMDAIATFEMVSCSLENAIVRKYYGIEGYGIALFSLAFWYSLTVFDCYSSPCSNLIDFLQRKSSFVYNISRAVFQLAGAFISYRYAKLFWSLELTEGHGERYKNVICTTDLNIELEYGFLIEFSVTLILTLLCMYTFTTMATLETAAKALVGTIFTCVGVDYTGIYANPNNASAQTYRCKGTEAWEHILVYWVAPLLATWIAVKINDVTSGTKPQRKGKVPSMKNGLKNGKAHELEKAAGENAESKKMK